MVILVRNGQPDPIGTIMGIAGAFRTVGLVVLALGLPFAQSLRRIDGLRMAGLSMLTLSHGPERGVR